MPWIQGDSLVSYIEKNLYCPAELRNLATAWTQMLTDLRQAKIAHGDLQHGNVLVVQGNLRLVDYDGMYVPALEGSRGIELGHRNYQHPQRTGLDFGEYLDNFSAWLIYASLIALAVQPELWNQLKGGDECLLFRKADFDAPERSAAFRLLKSQPDAQVRALADRIEYFLWLPLDQVPAIGGQEAAPAVADRSAATPSLTPSWMQDYVKKFAGENADEFPTIETGDQSWLEDHIEQKAEIGAFCNNVITDRYIALWIILPAFAVCAWVSFLVAPLLVVAAWIGGIGVAMLITITVWRLRYGGERVCATIAAFRADLMKMTKERDEANSIFEDVKSNRLRRRASFTQDGARLQQREGALQSDEQNRFREIDARLQDRLQQITNRMRSAAAEEGAEKRKLAETVGGEISRLARALSTLLDQEQQELVRLNSDIGAIVNSLASRFQQLTSRRDGELRAALKEYQDQIVNGHLQKIRLSERSVPGIGPQLIQRLAIAGFVSAGDVGTRYSRVPGIGAKKLADLGAWRQRLEGPIRAREAPKSLPPHKTAAIEQRYDAQSKQLQQNLGQEQARLAAGQQIIATRTHDQKRMLEQQKAASETNLRQQTAAIETEFSNQRKQIVTDEQTVRAQDRQATDDCRSEIRTAATQLIRESDQIKKDYQASLNQFNSEIDAAAKRVREISWRRNQSQRRCLMYDAFSFRQYSFRVLRRA